MHPKIEVMDIHDKKQRQRMLYLYSGITAGIILLEIIFRDQIYSASAQFAIFLQQNFPQTGFVWFFKFWSFFGTPSLLVPLLLILFASEAKKFLTMKLAIYLCFVGYTISVIKAIYRNPRPYWVYPFNPDLPNYVAPGIKPMEHYAEYGNPSGHAFLVTAFYGYLYYVFLYKRAVGYSGIARDERALSISKGESPMIDMSPGVRKQINDNEEQIEEEPRNADLDLEIQLPEQCNTIFLFV
jgi:membrane-associated phospholipid phosphatase